MSIYIYMYICTEFDNHPHRPLGKKQQTGPCQVHRLSSALQAGREAEDRESSRVPAAAMGKHGVPFKGLL